MFSWLLGFFNKKLFTMWISGCPAAQHDEDRPSITLTRNGARRVVSLGLHPPARQPDTLT